MDIVKNYHKDLIKYKNLHKGEVAYIFGSGPSLKKFKIQEEGVFIGCNKIYKSKYIRENLNYYFFGDGQKRTGKAAELDKYGDKLTYKEEVDLLIKEKKVQCFCNASMHGTLKFHHKFTKKDVIDYNSKGVHILDITRKWDELKPDIHENKICNHSCIFTSVHFALYCGFSKIYLVGCDCSTLNNTPYFFLNEKQLKNLPECGFKQLKTGYDKKVAIHLLPNWSEMKKFKEKYFRETEFININPVKLKKRMDGDIYT